MALTLNDEQSGLLEAWWRAHHRDPETGSFDTAPAKQYAAGSALLTALAPLMKPWRVERYQLTWSLVSPNGINLVLAEADGTFEKQRLMIAERICRVLNGEEKW